MVITDYLIETHSFFECPLQKLRLYDENIYNSISRCNKYIYAQIYKTYTHTRAQTHTLAVQNIKPTVNMMLLMVSLTSAPAVQNDVLKMTFWRIPREPRS